MMNSNRPSFGPWPQPVGLASCHAAWVAHGMVRHSTAHMGSGHLAHRDRSQREELERAASIVPGKEIGAAAHLSGRSMSRR
jgi:hypothetical protein